MKEWVYRGAVSDRGAAGAKDGRGIQRTREGDGAGWSKVEGTHAKEREARGDEDQCRSLWVGILH